MNAPATALFEDLRALCRNATPPWLDKIARVLRATAAGTPLNELLARLPETNNSDAHFQLLALLRGALGLMTWTELGWSLQTMVYAQASQQRDLIELVWTGPRPVDTSTLRRLDQALYDLILNARRAILLVTFAAAKITRLKAVLSAAAARGVTIRLVLEFEEESGGQLSRDALTAFSGSVEHQAEIYY